MFSDLIRRQTRQIDYATVKETRRFLAEKFGDTTVIALRHYLNIVFVLWNGNFTFDDHKSAKAAVKVRNIAKVENGASGTIMYNR